MLESGKRSLLLEAATSALNKYDKALLEWAGTERGNLKHATGGFNLGKPEDFESAVTKFKAIVSEAELSKATNLALITKTSVPLGEELKAMTLAIIIKSWGD